MSTSGMGPPGSGTYASNILNVGDGTWDSERNTFLLPNLMGLNFEAMRYNGMGNRFRNMPGYYSLILAHGVIGAIVFLGIVPIAIFLMKYRHILPVNEHKVARLHIWMQIMTFLLTTVVFTLGWFAVGPKRSLTNPHHGIGLAIYVLVVAQALFGWYHHHRIVRRKFFSVSQYLLHRWLGNGLALLGIAQIPLGLTLYGSPLSLFILFALAVFTLLLVFFIASYRDRVLAIIGPGGRVGSTTGAEGYPTPPGPYDRYRSQSSVTHEKDSEAHGTSWGKRLLQVGTLAGGVALIKNIFDRRRGGTSDLEPSYHPAHTVTDDSSLSRVEEGRPRPPYPPAHGGHHVYGPPGGGYHGPHHGTRRPVSPEHTEYTETEFTQPDEHKRGHTFRNAAFGAGAFAMVRKLFKGKKSDEDRRVEEIHQQDLEQEQLARAMSNRRRATGGPVRYDAGDSRVSEVFSDDLPPINPRVRPAGGRHEDDMSGSDTITTIQARTPRDTHTGDRASTGLGVGELSGHRRRSGGRADSQDPPSVSLHIQAHSQGRRITISRDAARADREARRHRRNRSSRSRAGSPLSANESDGHWRRVEERERQQAEELHRDQQVAAGQVEGQAPPPGLLPDPSNVVPSTLAPSEAIPAPSDILPPPPLNRIPGTSHYSPATASTDLSSYASRSDRRRAERRVPRSQRHRGQQSVEFA
ncbi:hypothetical protein FQN57_001994 [Myotisia sp. PD_48]|nr:hypothetical protein FQN57_001994 [Myotisia sp. PD_48]